MRHDMKCPSCNRNISVDLNREYREVRCLCGKYVDLLLVRNGKLVSKTRMRNGDTPKRKMGNRKDRISESPAQTKERREAAKQDVIASFPLWEEKLKLIKNSDAQSWVASLLWWQLYCFIPEICDRARAAWREHLLRGAGEISTEDFLKEIKRVGLDERILSMQCNGSVLFPEHLRP